MDELTDRQQQAAISHDDWEKWLVVREASGAKVDLCVMLSEDQFPVSVRFPDSEDNKLKRMLLGEGPPATDAEQGALSVVVFGCLCPLVEALVEALLQALESPMYTWACGGAFKSLVSCWLVLSITPWHEILPPLQQRMQAWIHSQISMPFIMGLAAAVALLVILCVVAKRYMCSGSNPRADGDEEGGEASPLLNLS